MPGQTVEERGHATSAPQQPGIAAQRPEDQQLCELEAAAYTQQLLLCDSQHS